MLDSTEGGSSFMPRRPAPAPAIAPPQPYAGIQAQPAVPKPNIIAPAPNPVNLGTFTPGSALPPLRPGIPLPQQPQQPPINVQRPAPGTTPPNIYGGGQPAQQQPTLQPKPFSPYGRSGGVPGIDPNAGPRQPGGAYVPDIRGRIQPGQIRTMDHQTGQYPSLGGRSDQQPFASSQPKPAIPLNGLGGLLEQNLGNPSRYDADVVKDAYGFLKGDLQREADTARSGAINDANSRGVYYGTPLSSGLAKVDTDYNRGLGSLATSLLMDQAHTYGNDRQASVDNAFRFGENQQRADQFGADLGLRMGEFGYEGAPNVNNAISQFGQLPVGGNGQPLDLAALGKLFAMLNAGKGGAGGAGAATTGVDYSGNNPYSNYV